MPRVRVIASILAVNYCKGTSSKSFTHNCSSPSGASIPLSQCILHITPISQKIHKFPPISSKIISKFSSIFVQIMCFGQLTFLPSPYFDHDAFVHHALHVLGAPDRHRCIVVKQWSLIGRRVIYKMLQL